MKLNKIILFSILLLFILSLGVVCAEDSDLDIDNMDIAQSEGTDNVLMGVMPATNTDDEMLISSTEGTIEVEKFDNMDVVAPNVFKGQNTTISVTAPEAIGTVNITVGEKTYTSELIGGVAKQSISEYNIGLNNVTVKYNDIVKETSFKGLDDIITNETFYDYFEKADNIEHRTRLRSFIPEGITLDFRGDFYFKQNVSYIYIDRPINLISTAKNAIIDVKGIIIEKDAKNSNISNIEFKTELIVKASNSILNNTIIASLYPKNDNLTITNSVIINYIKFYNVNNVTIINSTFKNSFVWGASQLIYPSYNLIIINSTINDTMDITSAKNCLLENNKINGKVIISSYNTIFRNNIVHALNSKYAVVIYDIASNLYNNTVVNNILYSKDYCGNNAVYDSKRYYNLVENNTPTQIDMVISTNKSIDYDEPIMLIINVSVEGNVIVDVNGQKHVVKLVNGTATQMIDKYVIGINNVTVVYDDLINYAINYTSFKVNKVDYCPVNLVYNNVTEEEMSVVNVILPEDAKGTITLDISSVDYFITIKKDANGSTNYITIPALLEGNYSMSATFTSVKYVTNSTTNKISSIHIPVYKLTANSVVMDYNDGSKYKVLVTRDGVTVGAGLSVNITFNGKTTNVKTDENGYATLTLDAAPKTYTIKVEYQGLTKSSKVTIKNVLKTSNISKKKAKNIKFAATLKTSKGKAIVGKKITFKFKGKTYSTKTNKKGVATITLKNLKVGKYTITSKYGACTIKNTIKIKK